METSIVPSLSLLQNFGNLRWIDRRGHVAIDDLKFSAGGLVCDGGYFSLDNLAAVEADPDAGAYAVIHIVSILASLSLPRRGQNDSHHQRGCARSHSISGSSRHKTANGTHQPRLDSAGHLRTPLTARARIFNFTGPWGFIVESNEAWRRRRCSSVNNERYSKVEPCRPSNACQ
jgi:hypothetical protein